jgi:small subunit ribosomal protein S1
MVLTMTDETVNKEAEAAVEEADAPVVDAEAEAPIAEVEASPVVEAETEGEIPSEAEAAVEANAPATANMPRAIEDLKVGMELKGKVKSIELYGAFVDIGVGKDALLHISQLGQQNVRNVEDVVKAGEEITVYVLKADADSGRIALATEKPPENPLSEIRVGAELTGKVVRIENFGAFVDIGAERPGMVHVSELSTEYINSPEDKVSVGQEVRVRVIKINKKKRQIDLSIKALEEEEQRKVMAEISGAAEEEEAVPTAMELALRQAMDDDTDGEPVVSSGKRGRNKKNRNSKRRQKDLNEALQRTLNQDT